jgi:hypothetical protein
MIAILHQPPASKRKSLSHQLGLYEMVPVPWHWFHHDLPFPFETPVLNVELSIVNGFGEFGIGSMQEVVGAICVVTNSRPEPKVRRKSAKLLNSGKADDAASAPIG